MPTRNVVKNYGSGYYYHVYNRGVDKMDIFRSDEDYEYFIYLLTRSLGDEILKDRGGRAFSNYAELVDLCAYCLMPNHFHMLIYLKEEQGITALMRSVMTAYSGYFNKKYCRKGPLFQNTFLASRITHESYFWHITRYIHLNPMDIGVDWSTYAYSSVLAYLEGDADSWLHPEHVVRTDTERGVYRKFLLDYTDVHNTLKLVKNELAG